MRRLTLLAAAALALAAGTGGPGGVASARPAAAAIGQPQHGLKVIPLTIETGSGKRRAFRVEYAGTEAEQATGMMFRPRVPRGTGMLFPMTPPRRATFWMHNTVSSLDLVFIAGGRVESIAARATPMSDGIVPSRGIVDHVLEIGSGEAKRLGIGEGDGVRFEAPQ